MGARRQSGSLTERRLMMQAWAAYVHGLRSVQNQQLSVALLSRLATAQSPPYAVVALEAREND